MRRRTSKISPYFTLKLNLKLVRLFGILGFDRLSPEVLSDEQIESRISGLDATAKKQWLMKARAAGTVTDDQVAMAFYQHDLGSA